ncbi:MAG: flagellar biosynthesis anti-sigma factor FlgM [Clostridiales Family XIII bacterium]|jgi:anti-sigma28 factor (negative regulator of flagellin synthesis)|nr:flagellar biosynthesis anti-sigma factor FlgM [Clostridiales Family XIII bacterium]
MEISLIGKPKALQAQTAQDPPNKIAREEDGERAAASRKVDSADISAGHAGAFEDKRLSIAKSTILYDISLSAFAERLEEIRSRVEDGSYSVPDAELADALFN